MDGWIGPETDERTDASDPVGDLEKGRIDVIIWRKAF